MVYADNHKWFMPKFRLSPTFNGHQNKMTQTCIFIIYWSFSLFKHPELSCMCTNLVPYFLYFIWKYLHTKLSILCYFSDNSQWPDRAMWWLWHKRLSL